MKALYLFTIFLSFLPIATLSQPLHLKDQTVIFCGETGEWPPFNFFKRINGEKTNESSGYDLDVVKAIFSEHGIKAKFEIVPWKRCLEQTKTGKYHVTFSASTNPERERDYLLSTVYYTVTPSYFYPKKRFPNGLNIQDSSELKKYGTICGRLGYNYVNFGLKNEDIVMSPDTYSKLVRMTLQGRCDVFLARYEPFVGWAFIVEDFLFSDKLGHASMPNVESENFYMLISRNYEYAYELKGILDSGIVKLRRSGKLKTILGKYISTHKK